MSDWQWDPSLYAGSAPYYAQGRMPYPPAIATILLESLGLDGFGSYLDIGCGPGSLTILLAPLFESATGIDADPDMIREASMLAPNITWRCMRAEELPSDIGPQRLITFAQSFHWMDRNKVAGVARRMLVPGGACVHVHATTHEGVGGSTVPRDQIAALVQKYLGPVRRAGQSMLPLGTPGREDQIYRDAGFQSSERIEVSRGENMERSADQVIASVFSHSGSAPHLFGATLAQFEGELRQILLERSPEGTFTERAGDIVLEIWR